MSDNQNYYETRPFSELASSSTETKSEDSQEVRSQVPETSEV